MAKTKRTYTSSYRKPKAVKRPRINMEENSGKRENPKKVAEREMDVSSEDEDFENSEKEEEEEEEMIENFKDCVEDSKLFYKKNI